MNDEHRAHPLGSKDRLDGGKSSALLTVAAGTAHFDEAKDNRGQDGERRSQVGDGGKIQNSCDDS
jgi:hypothetical protein